MPKNCLCTRNCKHTFQWPVLTPVFITSSVPQKGLSNSSNSYSTYLYSCLVIVIFLKMFLMALKLSFTIRISNLMFMEIVHPLEYVWLFCAHHIICDWGTALQTSLPPRDYGSFCLLDSSPQGRLPLWLRSLKKSLVLWCRVLILIGSPKL